MIRNLILVLLLNVAIIHSMTFIIKNESVMEHIIVVAYFKKFCGKGKTMNLELNKSYEIPDNKKIILEFLINDLKFLYETQKKLHYTFNIKNDGIYLEDLWSDGLQKDGLLLSIEPKKLFDIQ